MPAIHTINSIHWMLLRRLLAVWLLVALAVTGIGYYIEVNKFEEGLAAIAASEMRTLSAKVAPDGDKEQQVLAEETKDFIRKHYLWIRVYNHHGRLVRELYNPKYTNLTEALKATMSPMPHDGRRHFETRTSTARRSFISSLRSLRPSRLAHCILRGHSCLISKPKTNSKKKSGACWL